MPELNRSRRDQDLTKPLMVVNYLTLPQKVQPPALVLFTYSATGLYPNPHHEPVYNIDVAWPDDAPIIRAHDLGAQRNQRIYDYYARISPERVVYLYDRSVGELVRLGTARELSQGAGRPATGSAIRLD
jgi:hypothetical protein